MSGATVSIASIGLLANFLDSPATVVELAREAEDAGWHGVRMVEYEYDTFAFAQAVTTATRRVSSGSCISRAFTRHPLLAAQTAAAVDQLAAGRFTIGVGVGGVSAPATDATRRTGGRAAREIAHGVSLQRWGMASDRPAHRMREYVEVIRLALTGDVVDYAGEHFQFEDVQLSIAPTGKIPIYVGARGKQMLRVAGEAADGVYLWLVGEEATRDSIREVRHAAEKAGRTASEVTIGCLIPTCLDDDGEAARWTARRTLVDFYLGRAAYADVLAHAGFADVGERVHERVAAGKPLEAAAAIPDEALDQIAVAGTADFCREALARWTARGIEAPVLYVFPADGAWAPAYRRAIAELSPER